LKIETVPLENHSVKLIVELEPEISEDAKRRATRKLAKQLKIPGFRPGKAPFNVIQRLVGDEAILEEGIGLLLDDLYPKILEEAKVQPFGAGKFEKIANTDPLTLEFTISLQPEVQLGDYLSYRLPYHLDPITDEEVEETLETLRKSRAVDEPVERPAIEGDRIDFRISGTLVNLEEGLDSTIIRERAHSVIITGENNPDQDIWPFPAFSRNLIGLSRGDEKIISYTYPEDTSYSSLQNRTVDFKVFVEEVKSHTLPVLNDEFAQSNGEYETLDALRAGIRAYLEDDRLDRYHKDYDGQLISRLSDESQVKYPPGLLEEEIENLLGELTQRLKAKNLDLPTHLKTRGLTEAELREKLKPIAETQLKTSLVILELAEVEDIQLDPTEIERNAERTLNAIGRLLPESELKKLPQDEFLRHVINKVMSELQFEKAIERLRSIAKGEREQPQTEDAPVEIIDEE
jgi:trigger factor